MRATKLHSPVSIPYLLIPESEAGLTDKALCQFLAGILWRESKGLYPLLADYDVDARCEFTWAILIARCVSMEDYDSPIFPSYPLGGLSAEQEFTERDLLYLFAAQFFLHQELILASLSSEQDLGKKLRIVEALAVSQFVMDRAGGDDEVEACEKAYAPTDLAKIVCEIRALIGAAELEKEWAKRPV